MKNTIQTFLILIVAIAFPIIASASWWNPFSWNWFHKPIKVEQTQEISMPKKLATSTPIVKPKEAKKVVPLITKVEVPVVKAIPAPTVAPTEPVINFQLTITPAPITAEDPQCKVFKAVGESHPENITGINNMERAAGCPITQ